MDELVFILELVLTAAVIAAAAYLLFGG
jgi:hypothetical protein